MDWFVAPDEPGSPIALRRELGDYLRRHSRAGSDVDGAVLAAWEVLSNALRHAVGPVWVSLDWTGSSPVCEVHDLGPGFVLPPGAQTGGLDDREGGRGLSIVSHLTSELRVAAKQAGGVKVSVKLPVERTEEVSFPAPKHRAGGLPGPGEARQDGTFDRESFLRALVVQLAQAIELDHGPATVEAAVTQVGWDVGTRMEEEYRKARDIVESLSTAEIADLYVRLKHAIDGDFYVIAADDEKIELGNRRCPFGDDVVKRSPALCRMTSSVFGGIAARNRGRSSVLLEERIAVGDPECRVTVWLGPAAEAAGGRGHRYRAPSDPQEREGGSR